MKPVYHAAKAAAPDWERIEAAALTHTGWVEPCAVTAKAQVCYDPEHLLVRLEARESPVRATLTGALDAICQDSCLEFFFAPLSDDARYFNFEFNPLGAMFLGFGGERATRVRQIPGRPEELFHPTPFFTPEGWGIVFRIPLAFIRLYFPESAFRGEWHCNFYKCGELTQHPHYLAWALPATTAPDYHRRQDFGILRFE